MTPEALRNRLAHGNIYPPERIDAALANYFRPGNLAALRELALLWLADRVDEGLAGVPRASTASSSPGRRASGCSSRSPASPDGERLDPPGRAHGAARRTASSSASTCVPQDGLAGADRGAARAPAASSSTSSAASYHEVVGADVGDALLDAARSLNATQIVLGASRRSRWQRLTRGSVIGKVIRGSGARIDVHVISHPDARRGGLRAPADAPARLAAAAAHRARLRARRRRPPAARLVLANLREQLGLPSVLLLFLLLVVLAAAARRPLAGARRPPSAASCSSTGTSLPRSTRSRSSDGENLLALVVFLAVAAIVSRLRRPRGAARRQGRRAQAEAEALARLAGSARGRGRARQPAARARALDGAAVLHRTDGRLADRRGERRPHPRRRPRPATTTIELDDDHMLALAGRPIRRRGPARARRLRQGARGVGRARRARSRGAGGGRRLRGERASRRAPLRGLARPPHAARAIKASVTSLLQRRRRLDAGGDAASSSRRSTRRPTGSTRSSATCST